MNVFEKRYQWLLKKTVEAGAGGCFLLEADNGLGVQVALKRWADWAGLRHLV